MLYWRGYKQLVTNDSAPSRGKYGFPIVQKRRYANALLLRSLARVTEHIKARIIAIHRRR